jgi:predicted nuclease with RNAse H fold
MIGSQATKGMHVLAKYAPQIVECGAWSDGSRLTIIEAYPSACKTSTSLQRQLSIYSELPHEDCRDALICALIAERYARHKNTLMLPPVNIPPREGWIWIPRDVFD